MKRLLAAMIAVMVSVAVIPTASAEVTDGDIAAARDRMIAAQATADAAASRLGQARRDEIDAGHKVNQAETEIAELAKKRDDLAARLEAKAIHAYKNGGDLSSLSYFAGITDLGEDNRRQVYLQNVIEQDNRDLAEMASVKEDLDVKQSELQAEKERYESARRSSEAEKNQVDQALDAIAQEKSRLERQKSSEDAAKAAAAEAALASARQAASASQKAAADAASGGGGGGGVAYGGSSCPVQGGFTYTSFWGDGRNHRGIDMAAPSGTPTAAITGGTIARAGSGGGYGNMVYLAGDDGNTYLYAHHVRNNVTAGQRVSAGQIVGFVGSTGQSSGNHLHFEVHPGGGGAVNPYPTVAAVC